jgi:hypothetical protein
MNELRNTHTPAYERDLLAWRKAPFIAGIKIIARDDVSCATAQRMAGCYRMEDAPDYPFDGCEMESEDECGFCLCWWECIFDDEQPEGGWKVPTKRHPLAGGRIEVPEEPITEARIRRLAEVMNTVLPPEGKIREEDIQTSMANSGLRKPKGILERLRDWFAKFS